MEKRSFLKSGTAFLLVLVLLGSTVIPVYGRTRDQILADNHFSCDLCDYVPHEPPAEFPEITDENRIWFNELTLLTFDEITELMEVAPCHFQTVPLERHPSR